MFCHHCNTIITGSRVSQKISPGMICPVCKTDMSLPPKPKPPTPLSGGMLILLWVNAIFSGFYFPTAFSLSTFLGVLIALGVALTLGLLCSLVVENSTLRWIILLIVLAGLFFFATFYTEYWRGKYFGYFEVQNQFGFFCPKPVSSHLLANLIT